jgi:hypothetical protein
LVFFLKLSKAGYGRLDEIEKWDSRKVLQALYYENFLADYQDTYLERNK